MHNDDVIGKEAEYFGKIQSVSFKELSQMNRFMDELTPNGIIDRIMEYDDYITDPMVAELREKLYK